ncbi:MAG: AAA family ATPase [Planctomycetota bacterium]|nr:AAA family ATPase [Planctomycetota bacterium]
MTPTAALDRDRATAAHIYQTGEQLRGEAARRIVGLDDVVEQVLITALTQSHALLEGVPGLAKTLLLSTVAELMDLSFSRIQFTPDLMPSDITGSEYLIEDQTTGERVFKFAEGPIFANLVLADEVNRAPPKTQAALMEAMEERQVTSLGVSRALEEPFVVLATQNPIEQEGTYPLPAAQSDRFLFKIRLDYPDYEDEARIARLTARGVDEPLKRVLTRDDYLEISHAIQSAEASPALVRYAVELAQASRPQSKLSPPMIKEYVEWGVGPRAAQALIVGAKARAFLRGRSRPEFEDVRALAPAVFRHRMVLSYAAEADDVNEERIVQALLEHIRYPGQGTGTRRKSLWRRVWEALALTPEERRRVA